MNTRSPRQIPSSANEPLLIRPEVLLALAPKQNWRSPYFLFGLFLLAPMTLAALLPGLVAPYDPYANIGPALRPPGLDYLFGTDDLGRDLLSEAVWGAR